MSTLTPQSTPFTTVLVANRGEIALRVMRSARAAGYRTVAVHSTADADALHVQAADAAVCIGDALPAQSYLKIDAVIAAAKASGADAVHPGYGFLAENEAFAQACADAGLVFVGPSAAAILAMGHKAGAKRLMQAAGVPCIPGWQRAEGETEPDDDTLLAHAQRIGFPLMIKATAGGGGRGMRLVPDAAQFVGLLHSARSEARSAFGDDEVLLERAIVSPRHIEIQVLADRHGQAIHLGERDCSVQRRHQKVIEEAPSPVVGPELRARMGAAAVKAVQAIGYVGAGTLEFLLDADGHFYFMEMNTRLQVEHPVTEAITGLDLVALQLQVASGAPLGITQDQVSFNGHAIEVRLCAEDPAAQFMPQSGQLALWRPSAALRVEHGLMPQSAIPPYYDSMVAKLVAHGADRDEARRRLLHGLADTVALGVTTNHVFLSACLRHPVFAAGQATTAFIGQHQAELLAVDAAAADEALALGAALLYAVAPQPLAHPFDVPLRLQLGAGSGEQGPVRSATLRHQSGGCTLRLGEVSYDMQLLAVDGQVQQIVCNGVRRPLVAARDGRDGYTLHLQALGRPWRISDLSHQAVLRHTQGASDGKLRATMNGRVVAVQVAVGDVVTAGQPMVTLEAMKMEHVHAAPLAGTVTALHVSVGDQVSAHRVVAEVVAEVSAAAPAAQAQAQAQAQASGVAS